MVLDPIPQSLPVHFFGFRPQPPTSRHIQDPWLMWGGSRSHVWLDSFMCVSRRTKWECAALRWCAICGTDACVLQYACVQWHIVRGDYSCDVPYEGVMSHMKSNYELFNRDMTMIYSSWRVPPVMYDSPPYESWHLHMSHDSSKWVMTSSNEAWFLHTGHQCSCELLTCSSWQWHIVRDNHDSDPF